ncbi:hypothetical protein Oscil6304_0854 [Oscillatoria acuminata PCC 6304]|uniref:Uncharacterized protein n=1 Tax=Oscillatoria acuminata PCC 6304 TaxID=56110 RepID=K9TCG9_9CYAN|nr:hypothetical protein Oscil6304_0854 [Oscillatoria acuminata PCC 6304]
MLPNNQSDLSPNPSPKRGGALRIPFPAPPSLLGKGAGGLGLFCLTTSRTSPQTPPLRGEGL